MTERAKRLVGVTEHRAAAPFEVRADGEEWLTLDGYAAVFDYGYDIAGGPKHGGFTEYVDRRAFDETLSKSPDVLLLINHEGLPLARTKSATMDLTTDRKGLRVVARLDRTDPAVAMLAPKLRRGDMDEMSFAFRTVRQQWNGDETERRLLEVNIHKGDVSVVNYGASDATSVQLRNLVDAVTMLGAFDTDEAMAELRGLDDPAGVLRSAQSTLGSLLRGFGVKRMSVADAEKIITRS